MNNNQVYLTEEGLEKIKQELKYSVDVKRKEVAERIASAKELGDLSENAEYSDAKDEQAFLEGRIVELQNMVRHAVIIQDSNGNKDTVDVGCTVDVKNGDGQKQTFKIVGSQEADPIKGFISNESPIGRAFLGKRKGDTVELRVPKGVISYQIIQVR